MRPVSNPPSPFERFTIEWLDVPPEAELKIYEETCKSIISANDSPDVGFKYSVNPYRGCFHACAYCYARPSHQYLQFGAGTDFEKKLVVKINAAEKLEEAFMKPSWKGDIIVFSGSTDCYQPLEAKYELTKKCLEVALKFKNPIGIITKGALIERDIELLAKLMHEADISVFISLAFADDQDSKKIEPGAPRPSRRFKTIERLTQAGIPVGVGVAPIIPGLNDQDIPEILERAAEAGATKAFKTLVRLPSELKKVFEERIRIEFPQRADKVMNTIRELKGGRLNRSEFGQRMRGEGARWEAIEWLFDQNCKRLGFNKRDGMHKEKAPTFSRPEKQLSLHF